MDPQKATILVVDDNEENRDLLSRRLEKKGFVVHRAETGPQALAIVAKEPVDLVLLDVMMPGMSGLEVLEVLRRTRTATDLPVIMATARTESEDVVEALGLGANDYVTKPLDFPVVLARIEAQLRTRQAPSPGPGEAREGDVGPGSLIAHKYRLESKIGSGSFGTVYKARHLDLDADVAVKILQTRVSGDSEALNRFRREGISACRVRHPNAVTVMDFGIRPESGIAFLVMELLSGESLFDRISREGVLEPRAAAEILLPVCEVLDEAHRCGIVHRDIKPSNIFLHRTARGEMTKVVDFGIARIVGDAAIAQHLTVDGTVLGTPAYMAPERFRGQSYDGKADVYSVGITLFQVLTGRMPFVLGHTADPMALAMMHLHEDAPSPSALNPTVSPALEATILRSLRKDPQERPTAGELADALASALGLPMARVARPGPGPAARRGPEPATQAAARPETLALPLETLIPEASPKVTFTAVDAPTQEAPKRPQEAVRRKRRP